MIEQDWLTSNNPAEMGEFVMGRPGATYTGPSGLTPAKRISDRKMRLYCAAASSVSGPGPAMESWLKWGNAPEEDWNKFEGYTPDWTTFSIRKGWNHWMSRDYPTEAARANILRDLVGNPFRNKPMRWFSIDRSQAWLRWGNGPNIEITQNISDLALAAYSVEKIGCPRCDWTGKLTNENLPRGWQYCPHCEAKSTGHLDNDRLLVLSDSLEESGCTDPAVLNHLRGKVRCIPCSAVPWDKCSRCKGTGWVSGPNIHYRGCWVLDLILGYE